jgi:hypothetical protein
MHPIERLRYVARSQGVPASVLVPEAAAALMAFRHDPAGMVSACRRIIDRQVDCGPLWWLCSRILCGFDVLEEARRSVEEFTADPTADRLAEALAELGDDRLPVVVEARACGSSSALVVGRLHDGPTWLVAPIGTVLPPATFDVLCRRWSEGADGANRVDRLDLVEVSTFAAVVRPGGRMNPERALRRADCPVAPELFRLAG